MQFPFFPLTKFSQQCSNPQDLFLPFGFISDAPPWSVSWTEAETFVTFEADSIPRSVVATRLHGISKPVMLLSTPTLTSHLSRLFQFE